MWSGGGSGPEEVKIWIQSRKHLKTQPLVTAPVGLDGLGLRSSEAAASMSQGAGPGAVPDVQSAAGRDACGQSALRTDDRKSAHTRRGKLKS